MKIVHINRHFFRLKDEPNKLFFCTDAEADADNNAKVLHYVRANKDYTVTSQDEYTLRGSDLK